MAYRLPALALGLGTAGYALTVVLVLRYPDLRPALVGWPEWAQRGADLVVLSAPLLAAVLVAGRLAATGIGRATGIRTWRALDVVLGVLVGLVLRALIELVAPTTGSLLGPLQTELSPGVLAGAIVLVLGLVLVSPPIEELFFRGLILRALQQWLAGAGRIVAALAALLVSTAAFVVLHVLPWQAVVPTGLIVGTAAVGLGCGILTIVTGRLGSAVLAHVTSNAIGVALLLF